MKAKEKAKIGEVVCAWLEGGREGESRRRPGLISRLAPKSIAPLSHLSGSSVGNNPEGSGFSGARSADHTLQLCPEDLSSASAVAPARYRSAKKSGSLSRPFRLSVAGILRETLNSEDLEELRKQYRQVRADDIAVR